MPKYNKIKTTKTTKTNGILKEAKSGYHRLTTATGKPQQQVNHSRR